MFAEERQRKIVEIIAKNGSVGVEDLAKKLNVSSMTIRRDFTKLQKLNLIERTHGGALVKKERLYEEKKSSRMDEKQRIAAECAKYIREGDVVFLDAGTTTYEIAELIKDMANVIVVTTDLEIAGQLNTGTVEVFVCGGFLQKETGSTLGPFAESMINDFKFDIGFFGASSIDKNFEVATPTTEKMTLKRLVMRRCDKTILAVDSSKFGKRAVIRINDLGDYTKVVTDRKLSGKEEELAGKMHARIITV